MSDSASLNSQTFFIADLHLDPQRQGSLDFALTFFKQIRQAQALYILGDLFEYWIGDDAGMDMYPKVVDALAALSSAGCTITVMLGNRDFLLGDEFAKATGTQLVSEDELLIGNAVHPVLLMHGDTLCIDDVDYLNFRKQVRDTHWQHQFLSKSINERLAYAAHLREQSREKSAGKTAELMDVNERQVQTVMSSHQCNVLIHGHTHRPDIHTDTVLGTKRFVLGDWHDDRARYVVKDAAGLHLRDYRGHLCTPAPSA